MMILMGSERSNYLIIIIFMVSSSLLSSIVVASETYDPKALDTLFYQQANQTMAQRKTGSHSRLTQVPLPSNFSGMNVSIVRIRSRILWRRGIDSSFINIPPRVTTLPYVKRLAIVYYNLGNWSSMYYQVRGYSLVSPVVGFDVYDSSHLPTLSDKNVALNTSGAHITIHFPHVDAEDKNVTELKCVRFGGDGTSVEIKNMTERNLCLTTVIGSFSVVVASSEKGRRWKWWVILGCVGGGVLAVAMVVLVGIAIVRRSRRKKMESMEKESESGVVLDTFMVADNRMPSASVIRTQPMLEHDYVP